MANQIPTSPEQFQSLQPSESINGSKKMSRIRRACDLCNVKRTKCDGNEPCSHCDRLNVDCTYLRKEKKRGRASEKYPKEIKKRKYKTTENHTMEITDIGPSNHTPQINTTSPMATPSVIHRQSTDQHIIIQPTMHHAMSPIQPQQQQLRLQPPPQQSQLQEPPQQQPPQQQPPQQQPPHQLQTHQQAHQIEQPLLPLEPQPLTPPLVAVPAERSDSQAEIPQPLPNQAFAPPLQLMPKYPLMYGIETDLRLLGIPFNIADDLLEHYFAEVGRPPTNVFSILRPTAILSGRRPMHPTLLLTILLASTIHTDHWFFAGSRREQTYRTIYHLILERLVQDPYRLSYDEFIAVIHISYFQPWVAYPKDSIVWWRLACDTVRIFMNQSPSSPDEELKEEERRAWWAVYILDRITSFSFNLPPLMEDAEFFEVYIPCDELFWSKTSNIPLPAEMDSSRRRFVDYNHDVTRGIYGWFLPIAQLMAKLYEYKRDLNSPRQLQSIIFAHSGILQHNITQMERNFEGQLLIPHSEAECFRVDLLYAKYINMCIGFMTQYIQSYALISDFETDMETQDYERVVGCVEVLEQLMKLDPEMKRYPFLLGFFLFTIGYTILQILNDVNAATVGKINKFKYIVNVLVRVMEAVLIHFPAEFLKTIRNLLVRSLQDCEKLILLADHLPQFKINAQKRKDVMKAYSWLPDTGKGLAL